MNRGNFEIGIKRDIMLGANSMLLKHSENRTACCWLSKMQLFKPPQSTGVIQVKLNSRLVHAATVILLWLREIDLVELNTNYDRWEHSINRNQLQRIKIRHILFNSKCLFKPNQIKHKAKARIQLPYSRFDKRVFQSFLIHFKYLNWVSCEKLYPHTIRGIECLLFYS